MLIRALHHHFHNFLYNWFGIGERWNISGGEYWQHRILFESIFFSLLTGGLLLRACLPRNADYRYILLDCAAIVAILGVMELIRLRHKLKVQLAFEDLFYG